MDARMVVVVGWEIGITNSRWLLQENALNPPWRAADPQQLARFPGINAPWPDKCDAPKWQAVLAAGRSGPPPVRPVPPHRSPDVSATEMSWTQCKLVCAFEALSRRNFYEHRGVFRQWGVGVLIVESSCECEGANGRPFSTAHSATRCEPVRGGAAICRTLTREPPRVRRAVCQATRLPPAAGVVACAGGGPEARPQPGGGPPQPVQQGAAAAGEAAAAAAAVRPGAAAVCSAVGAARPSAIEAVGSDPAAVAQGRRHDVVGECRPGRTAPRQAVAPWAASLAA